jgi:hypothetical protein
MPETGKVLLFSFLFLFLDLRKKAAHLWPGNGKTFRPSLVLLPAHDEPCSGSLAIFTNPPCLIFA